VNPLAISVMHEKGIDISQQRSKHVTEYAGQTFRWVITVCDAAKEVCPVFPGHPTTAHFSFPDPAEAKGTEEERLAVFRSVRDRIENDLVRDFLIRFYTK
jgi:arsenate reductase